MRKLLVVLALSLSMLTGCSAGFRAGGERTGAGAEASIGHDPLFVTPGPR
jgi:hypothetical protein